MCFHSQFSFLKGGLLAGLLLLPLLTLSPALTGPFLFDDHSNLEALAILDGEVTASTVKEYLAEKSAGPTGRPLSMLSFMLDALDWPAEAKSFKLTNLLIHILNGLLLAWIVLMIVRQWSGRLTDRQIALGILVAAFWVLNPYQLSSVMYVVQRMAQLSTTSVLLGLILYLYGRGCIVVGKNAKGLLFIWLAYLCGAGIGVLFKENAALFVLMVPLFELLLFSRANVERRCRLLLGVTLVLPALVMIFLLGSYFFSGHSYEWYRDFTLSERLLSQGRAVGYYLWRYLIPGVGYVGIYADGFEKSVSLFQPLSTFIWIIVHGVLLVCAILFARRVPLFSLGVLFFYVAHSMESSAVPLELFFEHRNYLPSVFLLLGLFHLPRINVTSLVLLLLVLVCGALQYLQATYWGSERYLTSIMVLQNPKSERAVINYANYLEKNGEALKSLDVMRRYAEDEPAGVDLALNIVKMGCFLGMDAESDVPLLQQSVVKYRGKAATIVSQLKVVGQWIKDGRCKHVTLADLDAFWDNYLAAYPRDGEATQAYFVGKSYIAFQERNYAKFSRRMEKALDSHPNLSLAYSVCSQFTVSGGPEQGCNCFKDNEYMVQIHREQGGTLVQRFLGSPEKVINDYREEMSAVCAVARASEGDPN